MLTLADVRNGLADAIRDAARAVHLPAWRAADTAPASLAEVVAHYRASGELLVWSGASDVCIFDARTNHAFRAWHDWGHVRTSIGFTPDDECALARVQQSESRSDALAELVWVEVAEQALHFARTGRFIVDQVGFTLDALQGRVWQDEQATRGRSSQDSSGR